VRFGHEDGHPVLDGLDLHLAPGESLALVGPTGSGKSTIAGLLARLYDPDDGAVLLDGHNVRDLALGDVRKAVALVFEETFLFTDTVKENIRFARPNADDDAVARAAELAGAAEFVADLPDGYETVLGERGFSLSGGQRQRIAIARAILADPAVLVLDDATSAVDATKEHEIRAALTTVMERRTTLVIAHRPATIALADRVAVLDGGRIVEEGEHGELLRTSPRYRALLALEAVA
jgi:ATP-binding cassette subfamily B protein